LSAKQAGPRHHRSETKLFPGLDFAGFRHLSLRLIRRLPRDRHPMRNRLPALIILACLSGCATTPPSSAQPSPTPPPPLTPPAYQVTALAMPPPATQCRVLPITQYVWREGYPKMMDSFDQKDALYPLYVGLGTLSWAGVTPLLFPVDLIMLPLTLYGYQGCV
jgi:hypothetical protein